MCVEERVRESVCVCVRGRESVCLRKCFCVIVCRCMCQVFKKAFLDESSKIMLLMLRCFGSRSLQIRLVI